MPVKCVCGGEIKGKRDRTKWFGEQPAYTVTCLSCGRSVKGAAREAIQAFGVMVAGDDQKCMTCRRWRCDTPDIGVCMADPKWPNDTRAYHGEWCADYKPLTNIGSAAEGCTGGGA